MTKKVVAIITRLPALLSSVLTRLINSQTPASRQESQGCHKRTSDSIQLLA